MLSDAEVHRFIENGFVRIDGAFPREIADAGRPALWQAVGCDPHDRGTWTRPVVRIGPINDRDGTQPLSFRAAANTPVLHDAFDKLVGRGRWEPRPDVGLFVVRFPSPADPGWHVDLSFPGETGDPEGRDYSGWRVNITSKGPRYSCCFYSPTLAKTTHPRASASALTLTWRVYWLRPGRLEWRICNWLTSARNGTWLSQLAKQERCTCVILSSSTLRRSTKALRRAL
jgi:hypothetical protein